jgi:predicted dehydrogenase
MKIGLVGVGQHARWAVIRAIQETSKHCELAAACDIREESLAELREQKIPVYTEYEEMFQRESLDAAYICTLLDSRYEPALAALRAGLHIVCEKPLADTLDKCRSLIEEAERAERELIVVFETRYHGYNRKIREWIDAGYLGKIEAMHFQRLWDAHKSIGHLAQRRANFIERSGALDCGIHQLDIARYFTGGEWRDVRAMGSWFDEDFSNAPHISVMGRLSNGALVTLNASYAYTAHIKPRASTESISIAGTNGVINYCGDEEGGTLLKLTSEDRTESIPFEDVPHYLAIGWLLDDFAEMLSGAKERSPELASGQDGLIAQEATEQALRDARETRFQG